MILELYSIHDSCFVKSPMKTHFWSLSYRRSKNRLHFHWL